MRGDRARPWATSRRVASKERSGCDRVRPDGEVELRMVVVREGVGVETRLECVILDDVRVRHWIC